ncbi:MAG TPA: DUF308 domain-containing protein, partial [Pseudonocardiaceae bacterium]|nr:DUF308 domain-containing protein [Pseudonocardiaceae bacterium]
IAAAVLTVLWPAITILGLTILAVALFIVVGVAEIVLAVRLRKLIRGELFMVLAGLVGVIAGILILFWPVSGALALTIALGIYALILGPLLLIVAWRLRRLARTEELTRPAGMEAGSATRPQPRTP